MSSISDSGTGGFRIGYQNGTEHDQTVLPWTGSARPDWLRVRYLKDGPGLFSVADHRYRHWFDGLALLKQFEIGDEIKFRAKYLRSPDYSMTTRSQRICFTEFATAPRRSLLRKLMCTLNPNAQFGDNTSTNLQEIDGQIVTIGDLPRGLAIDPATLDTTDTFKIEKPTLMTSTPHPQRDQTLKTWFNIGIGLSLKGFGYHVYGLRDGSRRPEPVVFIPRAHPAYMHSVAMSEKYLVIAEHPMFASLLRFFTLGMRNKAVLDAFSWRGDHPLTLFIVDKSEKRVAARVEAPPCFYFHSTNAFDDGDDLVIDLCTYPDDSVIDQLFLDNIRGPDGGDTSFATLVRHRVHVPSGRLTRETLTDQSVEFPKSNVRVDHRPYRYSYAVSINPDVTNDHTNQLVKVDVATGKYSAWYEPGCYPNEPYMIPRPNATAEDDGVVLCVVLDAKIHSSILLILDAQSFTEIGRAVIPAVIPFGLHGQAMPLNH